jgi:hypothetical protein
MSFTFHGTAQVALLLVASAIATAQPPAGNEGRTPAVAFRELLPLGQVDVTILQPAATPRFTELAARLQQAARANLEWWTTHVRSAPAGQPLPYDARMGLSEAEYREMLSLADSVVVQGIGSATLAVSTLPHGWRLDGGSGVPEVSGIEIDTVARVVRTPFGDLRDFNVVPASNAQRATGRWTGPQWKLTQVDSATGSGVAVSFALGTLEANGRTLLYYDAKRAQNGQIAERAFRLLELAPRH